jgi:hypothetical protein
LVDSVENDSTAAVCVPSLEVVVSEGRAVTESVVVVDELVTFSGNSSD